MPANDVISEWLQAWAHLIPAAGSVLDLASGRGRHARWLARRHYRVLAVDRDAAALAEAALEPGVETLCADLENAAWPLIGIQFDGIVVTHYLHRPLMANLLAALAPGGVLIYETFAAGNGEVGKPSNPHFLLEPGELLDIVHGQLRVLAFQDVFRPTPTPAFVQRICAVREPHQAPADPRKRYGLLHL